VVDPLERLGGRADDLRHLLGDPDVDHGLVVLLERLRARLDRVGLGETLRLDDASAFPRACVADALALPFSSVAAASACASTRRCSAFAAASILTFSAVADAPSSTSRFSASAFAIRASRSASARLTTSV
jgi:hypothetical protein